jgi:hypothetical protein
MALQHRYSFNGSGTVATDSIGTAHGAIINTALNGTGVLALAGMTSGQYVDLPNGILAGLGDATFEVWLTWSGGDMWQRIFDFGSSGSEGTPAMGTSYLFLTPRGANPTARATFSANGREGEVPVDASSALPTMTLSHVAVVVNDSLDTLALYIDGASVSSVPFTGHLSQVSDINNWLGRSQFSADPALGATLTEFRIYRTALSAKQIELSHSSGPDATLQ